MTIMNDDYELECGPGWSELILYVLIWARRYNIKISRVKEKMGSLRMWAEVEPGIRVHPIWHHIDFVLALSVKKCELCGAKAPGIRQFKNNQFATYYTTHCDSCFKEVIERARAYRANKHKGIR